MWRNLSVAALVVVACPMTLPSPVGGKGAAADSTNPKLLAGVAKADITPEPGLRMWGYSARSKPATGKLDPLMAKAVVLKAGDRAVAIISLDLGRTPTDPLLAKLRERLAKRCGISNLFVVASHTHSAPAIEIAAYGEKVIGDIERVVAEAAGQLVPVQLGVGRGKADFSHNRRKVLPDGRVAMLWRNAERIPTEPVDREYGVIRLDTEDGKPLAILFNYACHPVVLGPDNLQYSADYVGAACHTVEESLRTTCLFLQGACGDINPYMDKTPIDQGGVKEMRHMGESLGALLTTTAKKIEPKPAAKPALKYDRRPYTIGLRWDNRQFPDNSVKMDVTTLLVNDQLALVGMPGEFFVKFQMDLKQRSPVADTFFAGYCNGYFGYFPTIRDAALGGYGGTTATVVSVGTGERLVDDAIIGLYKLTGKISDVRRPEDSRVLQYDRVQQGKPRVEDQPSMQKACIDGTGPGWTELGENDFINVNCNKDTWNWKNGILSCTGTPVGVTRSRDIYTNFELVVQWRHLRSGGNSGVFVWVPADSIKRLRPGQLPHGIEVQVLDHGYAEEYRKQTGKQPDWFTTHGDVFPVGTSKMTPFPPVAPDGKRSFPSKHLSKGIGEWNHYYVRCINGEVRLWVNGEEVSGGTACEPRTGYVCLESEGSPIEFKQIRLRKLP